jgi:hypothetical protein
LKRYLFMSEISDLPQRDNVNGHHWQELYL